MIWTREEVWSLSALFAAAQALEDALDGFEARVCSGEDAAGVVERLARVVKRCEAAIAQAALRASECGAHRDEGFSSPSEWLSRKTGSSSGEAHAGLRLAARFDDLADTKAALDRGDISLKQAGEIATTEEACPGSERELLDVAQKRGLRALRERARRLRQEAIDPDELAERRRQARRLSRWVDEAGMRCGTYRLEPHRSGPFEARLDAQIDRDFRAGDDEYRREPYEARAADAFLELVEGQGRAPTTRPELVVVFDADRGRAHLPALGPLDQASLVELARHAMVTAVVHDGEDVHAYQRFDRHVPKVMRLLLSLGGPPDFDGAICADCGRRFHLQLDHVDPVANDGPTAWWNLEPRCPRCHLEKTERDRRAGLLGRARESVRMAPRMARRHTHTRLSGRAPP